MDIKTKYGLGQRVFFMDNNKVQDGPITRINIGVGYTTKDIEVKISYNIFSTTKFYEEEELFLTKEELLKSL